jgi:ribosomal protein S18 acetylase RimI-like enzyme
METTSSKQASSSADRTISNPFWEALHTEHAGFAIGSGLARRYPADVIPFGGVGEVSVDSLTALHDLLGPEEGTYLATELPTDRLPRVDGLTHVKVLPGWQMHFGTEAIFSDSSERGDAPEIEALGASEAPVMQTLTSVAFPGFLRPKTYQLGSYFGLRVGGELIAMAGERVAVPGFREISAVCTHPAHTGRGYAARLVQHLLRRHRKADVHSFLHVAAANGRAIQIYERLGFVKTIPINFHQFRRI